MTDAVSLQALLEAANDRLRILGEQVARVQRENEEIRSRNDALETDNAQLRTRIAVLSECGWQQKSGLLR